ncbi:hypothetical protein [Blastococcus sp. SYSU D00813]
MRSRLPVLAVLAAGLLAGCGSESSPAAPPALDAVFTDAARAAQDGVQAELESLASSAAAHASAASQAQAAAAAQQAAEQETAARLAAEEAARAAAEAAAEQAAREAAAAQAVIDAEGGCPGGWYFEEDYGCVREDAYPDDPYYDSSDLEVRCSDGTATVEECFGPGSDLDGNGVADVNE